MAMKSQSVLGSLGDPAYIPPWQMAPIVHAINKNPVPSNLGSVIESEVYRHRLLAMRLRLLEGETFPYQDLFTSLAGDKVFVFVVQDNQAVTLEDNATMFPSDQLITQLRLLDK